LRSGCNPSGIVKTIKFCLSYKYEDSVIATFGKNGNQERREVLK